MLCFGYTLPNNVLLDVARSTFLLLTLGGTEKKMGFLKLKGLSVMKPFRLSFVSDEASVSSQIC